MILIGKKFIRNSIIYTIAGSLPLASAILLLPFYANYLSREVFGALSLYLSFTLLVQIFITYSFDSSVYVYFHEFKSDPLKLNRFVSSAFNFILLLSLLIGGILALTGGWIFERVFTETKILFFPYGLISVLTGIFQSLFKVNSSLQQTQEKATAFLWYNLLSFSLIAFFTIAGLYLFPDDLIGPIGGRFVAVALSGLWVLAAVYRNFGFHFDFQLLRSTFGFSHPALLYQVMQWFNGYYDRVLMTRYLPLAQVGIYDFAMKCLLAIEFALAGAYNSFFPKVLGLVALQTEKKTTVEINRYYNGLTAVTILLVSGCIFFFPLILEWVISLGKKTGYLSVIQWIPYIAVTYLLRTIRFYISMPYSAIKYTKPLPVFYLCIVAVKIASMIFLIPSFGIFGAILATWIGYSVEVVFLFFGIRSKFKFEINIFKTVIAPLLMAVVIVVLEPTLGKEHPILIHGLYILVAIGLLAWAYRNEIKVLQWSKIIK